MRRSASAVSRQNRVARGRRSSLSANRMLSSTVCISNTVEDNILLALKDDRRPRATAELLKEINRDRTVVVVEHDMAFVRELGVKVTVLHEGAVIAEGSIDQVSTNERVIEVYLGR